MCERRTTRRSLGHFPASTAARKSRVAARRSGAYSLARITPVASARHPSYSAADSTQDGVERGEAVDHGSVRVQEVLGHGVEGVAHALVARRGEGHLDDGFRAALVFGQLVHRALRDALLAPGDHDRVALGVHHAARRTRDARARARARRRRGTARDDVARDESAAPEKTSADMGTVRVKTRRGVRERRPPRRIDISPRSAASGSGIGCQVSTRPEKWPTLGGRSDTIRSRAETRRRVLACSRVFSTQTRDVPDTPFSSV